MAKYPPLYLRLHHLFYAFAVVASSLALFGGLGFLVALGVLLVWGTTFLSEKKLTAVEALVLLAIVGILVGLLMPAVQTGGSGGPLVRNANHLMGAIQRYHSDHGHFPPPYVADEQGRPLYSWRVLLLPYLGETALYSQFRLNEPWDSSHNRPLVPTSSIFTSPHRWNEKSSAHYLAVVGEPTVWDPLRTTSLDEITDPADETLVLVEAGDEKIHWSEPRDLSLEEGVDLLVGKHRQRRVEEKELFVIKTYLETDLKWRQVGLASGEVDWIGAVANKETALGLLTKAGGEPLTDLEGVRFQSSRPLVDVAVRWDRVWGVGLWLVIVLLPMRWVCRGT